MNIDHFVMPTQDTNMLSEEKGYEHKDYVLRHMLRESIKAKKWSVFPLQHAQPEMVQEGLLESLGKHPHNYQPNRAENVYHYCLTEKAKELLYLTYGKPLSE